MDKYICNTSSLSLYSVAEDGTEYKEQSKIVYEIEKGFNTSEEHVVKHLQRVATDLLLLARNIESNGFENK